MKKTFTFLLACVLAMAANAELKEYKLYSTNFQNWEEVASSTTPTTKTVTTDKSKETLTFEFAEVQIAPTGTQDKFTNTEVITPGYAMAAKTATPYIETSVLSSVTKVSYVHAATGGSRGWGLQYKVQGESDWTTIHSDYCAQAGTLVQVDVNKENVQLRWYNLNSAQNAYMTEFTIYGNVEVEPRKFVDFEIDLTTDPVVLPAGVTGSGASYNGAQHGWIDYTITFDVDGPVKMTFGGCQYANKLATVTDAAGTLLATVDIQSVGCYHNGGTATWTYNVEEAATLTVYLGQYSPYFKAEACDYVANHTVTYFDTNDKIIEKIEVAHGTPFNAAYREEVIVEDGSAFRGWFTNVGAKVFDGTPIEDDLKVYATVTAIEVAQLGAVYDYNLADPNFYEEDHECFIPVGGKYYNNHGWIFQNGEQLLLPLHEKAYIQFKMCQYSNAETATHATKGGVELGTIQTKVESDGTGVTYFYDGVADTLVITFEGTTYVHGVAIYNVASAVNFDEQTGYYVIEGGDASSLLLTLLQLKDGDKVFLKNGIYDLGERVLTQTSVNNVSIIGESMEGTIIRNAPDAATESINNTATLYITGNNTYLQDLTLQNALDYYKANNGRAVALWDKGTQTICKNVRLLSYQDTYYSNKIGAVRYFEDGSIHGTVDYICGDGSVYFKNVELYCEKRNANGGGSDAVTASNADKTDKGYVFEGCVLRSECPTVSLGRAWNNQPQTIFLNTIVDYSAGEFSFTGGGIARWTESLMNPGAWPIFGEYNTVDTEGNVINPASNVVTFLDTKTNNETKQIETIFTAEQAAAYSYDNFFGTDWDPAAQAAQATLAVTEEGGKVKWTSSASLFLVYVGEDIYAITSETELDLATAGATADQVSVRAANQRGGFSAPVKVGGESVDGVENIAAQPKAQKRFVNGMLQIELNGEVFNALGQKIAK